MAEAAVAETAPAETGDGASGAPSSSQSGGSTQTGDQSAQPQAVPTTPQVAEPNVPWAKFRQVQTDFTRSRQQWAEQQKKFEADLRAAQELAKAHQQAKDDYTVLEQLLNAHPDLAEQLYQRVSRTPGGRQAAPAQSQNPEFQQLMKEMSEIRSYFTESRKAQQRQREEQEDQLTRQQLDESLGKLLAERELNPEFLGQARAYVLARAANMPDLQMDEVPFLFHEWYKPLHSTLTKQVEGIRSGKQADRGLPASPGSSPTIGQRPSMGAMDNATAKSLEEMLEQRLGWKNQ